MDRLRLLVELAGSGVLITGDWTLWLELRSRALRDDGARAVRESLDRRWRAVLRQVIVEGMTAGVFHPTDVTATTLRLTSLMDGLAIQLALGEPGVTSARFKRLWLDAAALELGVPAQAFRGRGPRVGRRRAAS